MIVIEWKGKIGYGDVASPIAWARTYAAQQKQNVRLRFHWPHGPEHKYKAEDPETLPDRANVIFSEMEQQGPDQIVELEHLWNSDLPYNHNIYDGSSPCHNSWRTAVDINPTTRSNPKLVVVNSSDDNPMSLAQYDITKTWKDPLAVGQQWGQVFDELKKRNYEVARVSYTTPIEELRHWYSQAALVIGYHGSTAWYAKAYMLPMLLFSAKAEITGSSFPWSCVRPSVSTVNFDELPIYIRTCKQKLLKHVGEYEKYTGRQDLSWVRYARESCI